MNYHQHTFISRFFDISCRMFSTNSVTKFFLPADMCRAYNQSTAPTHHYCHRRRVYQPNDTVHTVIKPKPKC